MECYVGNGKWREMWNRMSRRKIIEADNTKTVLNRYLTTTHLTFMGVGATVGVGIYVLIGIAAKETAGPGLLVSFVLAGIVTLANAVIYAEFGSRIPTTGAGYTYIYESLCEGLAFIAGWLMLLGFLTSGAIGCRAWSGYFDSLFDNAIQNFSNDVLGTLDVGDPFSKRFDVLASMLELVAIVIVSLGIHASATVNIVLSLVSVSVLIFVTIMGFVYGDIDNVVNSNHGGFFPFGFRGVLVATSSCLYAYGGYDVVCMTAEECKNPNKSVPRAILIELCLVTLLYAGSSFAMVMLVPYYTINKDSPLPSAFEDRGIIWAKYIVTFGPVLGIGNLNLLNLYSTSRHLYCMSNDGLFFTFCGKVNKRAQVPLIAAIVSGLIIAACTLVLKLEDLVKFNVVAAYCINIILSCGVLILRSQEYSQKDSNDKNTKCISSLGSWIKRIKIEVLLVLLVFCTIIMSSLIVWESIFTAHPNQPGAIIPIFIIMIICIIAITVMIKWKMVPSSFEGFKVPMVPFLPVVNIIANILLLLYSTESAGLVIFLVLVFIGCLIYFVMICSAKKTGLGGSYSRLENENSDVIMTDNLTETE